ncbi:MAG: primosomal protein N' [Phycisphaerae bacterium]|nr:primosomal protein N' [Phycisphaerae bacterium]
MGGLFEEPVASQDASPDIAEGPVVGVVVNANLWGNYDYIFPEALGRPSIGQRVRVPFGRGNRKTPAFITEINATPSGRTLKTVAEVLDAESPFEKDLWELGQWISRYYLTPPGMVLSAMIPSAVGKHGPRSETVVFLTSGPDDWPKRLGLRQRKLLDSLLEARRQGVEPLRLEELLEHSGAGRDTLRRLLKHDLIRTESRRVTLDALSGEIHDDPFDLNDDQQAALKALEPKLAAGQFSATLLHGVTGSGKTEVYIRAIRRVVEAGKQAILMTPEIALATQTVTRIAQRLPRVAILHSALGDAQRAFYWRQIREGEASVVIGPRSAVFAPTRKLGLVIVDEEHEPSYKQDTAPRYHGRDVAVMRASIAGAPVILGSATPSLESLHNVRRGRYELLRLPKRVRGLAMPRLKIVHLREDMARGRVELLGRTLTEKMAQTLDRDEQIILLMNRRGYASHVFCPSCHWVLHCDDCLRPMVWHQAIQLCLCHHCDHKAELPEACPACGGKVVLFGYGIQRIEDELTRKFPTARVARMDSDTMTSPKQFQAVLGQFGAGEVDILLGTQMVAKGLDFPRVSLVGIASADTSLVMHDFRASERTFQLIVQVAGRAGRGQTGGEVIVQTLHADDPAIRFAESHDYSGFAEYDLEDRREAQLPPFSRMIRFLSRHEKVDVAHQGAEELARQLRSLLPADRVRLIGPMQAEFVRIRNRYRFQVLLTAPEAGSVQAALQKHMAAIQKAVTAEIIVDVDPLNLL